MNKKIIISIIGLLLAFIIFSTIWNLIIKNDKSQNLNSSNLLENGTNISDQGIEDECTEEWKIYNEEIKEVSSELGDKNTHYLIKNTDGYICIYFLDEKKREVLYKKTTISTEYLSKKDLENLNIGVEVIGLEEVNKVLEDFE